MWGQTRNLTNLRQPRHVTLNAKTVRSSFDICRVDVRQLEAIEIVRMFFQHQSAG